MAETKPQFFELRWPEHRALVNGATLACRHVCEALLTATKPLAESNDFPRQYYGGNEVAACPECSEWIVATARATNPGKFPA